MFCAVNPAQVQQHNPHNWPDTTLLAWRVLSGYRWKHVRAQEIARHVNEFTSTSAHLKKLNAFCGVSFYLIRILSLWLASFGILVEFMVVSPRIWKHRAGALRQIAWTTGNLPRSLLEFALVIPTQRLCRVCFASPWMRSLNYELCSAISRSLFPLEFIPFHRPDIEVTSNQDPPLRYPADH